MFIYSFPNCIRLLSSPNDCTYFLQGYGPVKLLLVLLSCMFLSKLSLCSSVYANPNTNSFSKLYLYDPIQSVPASSGVIMVSTHIRIIYFWDVFLSKSLPFSLEFCCFYPKCCHFPLSFMFLFKLLLLPSHLNVLVRTISFWVKIPL